MQKEQGLEATHCQDELDASIYECRENHRSSYVAFGRSATVVEDELGGTRRGYILNILIHQDNTIS